MSALLDPTGVGVIASAALMHATRPDESPGGGSPGRLSVSANPSRGRHAEARREKEDAINVAFSIGNRNYDVVDGSQVGPMLDQIDDPIASFTGDGACDQAGVYTRSRRALS
jgi:hypothetical protein